MKRSMTICAVAVAAFLMVTLSQAAVYTWTGANGNGDWTDGGNWDGGVPFSYLGSISGRGNSVVIDGSLASQPSINVATEFDALHTPGMVLTGGATLSLQGLRGNGGTGHGPGSIADVSGAGSLLTLTSANASSWQLSRELTGTEVWTVSDQGTIVLTGTGRIDMGFNTDRLTQINLDNGSFIMGGSQIYGSRSGGATASNDVILDNGSLFATTAYFKGNMWTDGDATLNFDIKDTSSVVRFRAGTNQGVFGNEAALIASFGTTFTSSTFGDANLVATDIGGGLYEVTVIPEPATLGLIAVMGAGLIAVRRLSMG